MEPSGGNTGRFGMIELLFPMGWLFCLLLFYPGFMSVDSAHQLLEARRGEIGDWHAPFMTWLWQQSERLIAGSTGMLVIQLTLVWGGVWSIYRAAFRKEAPVSGAILLVLMLLSPPMMGIMGVIWKDILMLGFLAVATGAALGLANRSEPAPRRRMAGAIFLLALLGVLLVRVNAVFLVTPLAIAGLWLFSAGRLGRWLVTIVSGGALAAALLLASIAINGAIADRKTHSVLSIVIFDIAGAIANAPSREVQEEIFALFPAKLTAGKTVDDVVRTYSPRYWQYLFFTEPSGLAQIDHNRPDRVIGFVNLDEAERGALKAAWVEILRNHTGAYLAHRRDAFIEVLGLSDEELWDPVFMFPEGYTSGPAKYTRPLAAALPPEDYMNIWQGAAQVIFVGLTEYPFYRPWFYALLALVLLAIAARRPSARPVETALLVGGLLHLGSLFFLAPSPDFRYTQVLIFTTLTTLFLLLLRRPAH